MSTPTPTPELFIPQIWQFLILLIVPISVIIGVAVKITKEVVNILDVRLSEHPLLSGYREFEKKQAVETIDGLLKKWEEENQRRKMSQNTIPLNLDEIHRRRELTMLFREGTINYVQVDELRSLLEREKAIAEQQGNEAIVVALGFLLGLVIGYLVSKL